MIGASSRRERRPRRVDTRRERLLRLALALDLALRIRAAVVARALLRRDDAVATGFLPRGFSAEALAGVAITIATAPSSSTRRRRAVAKEFGMGMEVRVP